MFDAERLRVLAPCPVSGEMKPTHARMTARAFARFKAPVLFWCRACGRHHEAPRETMRLERAD